MILVACSAYAAIALLTYLRVWRWDWEFADRPCDTSELFCLFCGVFWPLFWPVWAYVGYCVQHEAADD